MATAWPSSQVLTHRESQAFVWCDSWGGDRVLPRSLGGLGLGRVRDWSLAWNWPRKVAKAGR